MSPNGRKPVRRVRAVRRSAFTLIELLLVLVILGILMAIVVPRFTGRTEDAKIAATKTTVRTVDGALAQFEQDTGRFPTPEEGLSALMSPPAGITNWKGPYMKGDLKDQWQNDLVYRYPGTINVNGPDVFSMGKDGKEGGDEDLGNWVVQK